MANAFMAGKEAMIANLIDEKIPMPEAKFKKNKSSKGIALTIDGMNAAKMIVATVSMFFAKNTMTSARILLAPVISFNLFKNLPTLLLSVTKA